MVKNSLVLLPNTELVMMKSTCNKMNLKNFTVVKLIAPWMDNNQCKNQKLKCYFNNNIEEMTR